LLFSEAVVGDLILFQALDPSVVDLAEYLKMRDWCRQHGVGYWFVREARGWKPGADPDPFIEAMEEMLVIFGKLTPEKETAIKELHHSGTTIAEIAPVTGLSRRFTKRWDSGTGKASKL
jgi:hypothetical protein